MSPDVSIEFAQTTDVQRNPIEGILAAGVLTAASKRGENDD